MRHLPAALLPCLLGLLLLAGPACRAEEEPSLAEAAGFLAQVVMVGDKAGGCDVGDLDPDAEGDEIAVVTSTGKVHLLSRAGGVWASKQIAEVPGEMIQCAIGDADPTREGNELVVVGMREGTEDDGGKGAAYLLTRGSPWRVELIFEDAALIHGVAVADLDPDRPGDEVLVDGFSRRATVLAREAEGFATLASLEIPGNGKAAIPFQEGAAVACQDGSVVHVHKGAEGWRADPLFRAPAGAARLARDGARLLVALDDGALVLWNGRVAEGVHREGKKLRGAGFLDAADADEERWLVSAGYAGEIAVLRRSEDGAWRPTTVWRQATPFHHLVAARGLSGTEGLVATDTEGRVVVLSRR